MSEQYAFAIGFDRESEETGERPDDSWMQLLSRVSSAVAEAGLPPIESERWDEFGQGRVFWGSQAECDAVREVLLRFDLYIEEDRNLDPGYYSTADNTYYVDPVGQIYKICGGSIDVSIQLDMVSAIPLDAYRVKSIDPALDEQVQARLSSRAVADSEAESQPEPALESSASAFPEKTLAESTGTSEALENLQKQVEAQVNHISGLELQLRTALTQVDDFRNREAAKVERSTHESLQHQYEQQAQRVEALEAQLRQAEEQTRTLQEQAQQRSAQRDDRESAIAAAQQEAQKWQAQAEQAIDPAVHDAVQQKSAAQASQIQELQRVIQRLEQQLQETTANQSAQKISAGRYEAIEEDLNDKTALIADLRRTIQQQERDLREWQTVAEAKVDWAEHQALQAELRRLQARPKRGLFARLFGWLWR